MELHTGELVLQKLKEKGIKKSQLARMINTSRQNVQDMLKRQSLDSQLLYDLSKALEHNFFEDFSIQYKTKVLNLPELPVAKDQLKFKLEELSHKLNAAETEINNLKKLNTILEKEKAAPQRK